MAVYVCGCLNVKIHAREIHSVHDDGDDESQPFLGRKVAEVILDDQGIVIEQSYLLHRESSSSGWVQYQCVNCSWRTHAIRSASDTSSVLINMQLESDPAVLIRRTHSPDFSSVFNIVLQDHDLDNVKIPDGQVYESLESGVNHIQEQLNAYLGQERSAMEDRIRTFEQEQRSQFAQLQAQCEKEKTHMISLVVKTTTQEKPQFGRGDHSRLSEIGHPSPNHLAKSKPKPEVGSGKRMKTRSYSHYDQNPDSEALFYLDELEPELEEPFYDSGDDISVKSSEGNISNNHTTSESNKLDLYSTSVPISVPMWQGRRSSSTEEEGEEVVTPADPDQIAANMQALAQSITDTGRYIFGERPRPRLNTGDNMTRYNPDQPRRRLNTADSTIRRK